MLARARGQMRERAARVAENERTTLNGSAGGGSGRRERQPGEEQDTRRVPGGMGDEDDP